ncbi:MAG: nitrile hydratase accessory protein [Pseudomonadota bacterium]
MSLADLLPAERRDADGPVFDEPWQARAFAMTLALHGAGAFEWREWAETLGRELAGGGDYYRAWLAALERIATEKALTDDAALAALKRAWLEAAAATPHGRPIELEAARSAGG